MPHRRWLAMAVLAALLSACGTLPRGSASDPTPVLSDAHPCAEAASFSTPASDSGAGSPVRSSGGVTFSCATLTVPLGHAGLHAGPKPAERLSLRVAMADNADAPRGVLIFLTGGPGQPGVPFLDRVTNQLLDPAVLRAYRLVLIDQRGTGGGALRCPRLQQVMGTSDLTVPPASAVQECAQTIGPPSPIPTGCMTDPARDLFEVVRARHNGPELFDTLTGLSVGKPRLTGVPAALHDAARGDDTKLDAIVTAEHPTPVAGRAAATAKAVAELPDAAVFPYDRATVGPAGSRPRSPGSSRRHPRRRPLDPVQRQPSNGPRSRHGVPDRSLTRGYRLIFSFKGQALMSVPKASSFPFTEKAAPCGDTRM